MSQTQKLGLVASGLFLLLLCVASVAALSVFGIPFLSRATATRFPSPVALGTRPPLPTLVAPQLTETSTPQVSNPTLDQLLDITVPRNDPSQIVTRLKESASPIITPAAPETFKVGDKAPFWVSRDITGTNVLVTATLKYVTPHSYFWLEDGESASDDALKQAGISFETKVYPTNVQYLGEPSLGIDNDVHIFILNTHFSGSIAGYISQVDEYPRSVNPISNEHKMIYMNLQTERPGTSYYSSITAHEFAHLIHEHQNPREGSWITEGLGDLAIKLNGFPQDVNTFVQDPDIQLDAWANMPAQMVPHYLASYLFLSYSLNRFGPEFIRDIVSSDTHDIATIQQALNKHAPGLKFDDLFADWVVANFLNDKTTGTRYAYLDRPLGIRPETDISQYPNKQEGTVHQYAAQYIELEPTGHEVTFTFDGSTQVKAIPTDPHSGKLMWWSNRVDNSDTTLTHAFDLTSVKSATLSFWTWYNIEANFDYAYIEASTDEGKSWTTLSATTTTNENPNGVNYGNGITCKSRAGCDENPGPPQWLQEKVDLSGYAGKKIMLRFEYITDGIYAAPGLAIDDISIPEINFFDDAEKDDNGWIYQGFSRLDNSLAQRFILQAIEYGQSDNPLRVTPIALDKKNHGTFTTAGLGKSISRIVLVISGNTPITWETASYSFAIE